MFRTLIITAALAAIGLSSAAPADAARKPCDFRGTGTLVETRQVRVFEQRQTVWGCIKKTGKYLQLEEADQYAPIATAGKFVAYVTEDSVVNVQRIPDGAIPSFMPTDTGGEIVGLVVKPNGAAAWAVTPLDDPEATYVQGMERAGHAPTLFSDNELGAVAADSLTSVRPGPGITWTYDDGTPGAATLFMGPAEVFGR